MDNKYKSVCRVCLVKDTSSPMRPLAVGETREMFIKCTSISVTPGDKYPQQLCIKCWIRCKSCSVFQTLARDSDRQLRLENEEENILKPKKEMMDEEEEISMVKEEPLQEELVQEDRDLQMRLENGKKMMCEREEEVIVKKEVFKEVEIEVEDTEDQLNYLQGYSLAPESGDEEDSISSAVDSENTRNEETEGPSVVKANKCGVCSKTFVKLEDLTAHIRVHASVRTVRSRVQFDCDKCDTDGSTEKSLAEHKLEVHSIKSFKCWKCGELFDNNNQLKTHQLVAHFQIKQFSCDKCDTKCKTRTRLAQHKLKIHNNNSFDCVECDKKFTRRSNLYQHKETHRKVKPFKCDICDKVFRIKSHLASHKETHTDIRAFECDQCDKKYKTSGVLREHKYLIHTGLKPFQCDECDWKFARGSELKRHKKTHLEERAFKCSVCDKKFKRKSCANSHCKTQH